jgi:hypothetical protein
LVAKALGVSPARHCLVLSLQWAVVHILGDVNPLSLDICGGDDCPGICSPDTRSLRAWLPGAWECPELGYKVGP